MLSDEVCEETTANSDQTAHESNALSLLYVLNGSYSSVLVVVLSGQLVCLLPSSILVVLSKTPTSMVAT